MTDRRIINGIFYILRTGSSWRDLPDRYGPYTTAYIATIAGPRQTFGYGFLNRWRRGRRIRCI